MQIDTLSGYYAAIPKLRAARLNELEKRIRALTSDLKVSLKYKMPTLEGSHGWLAIGNQKHHLAVYTCRPELIQSYIDTHPKIDHGKGCLRFGDSVEIDFQAIDRVISAALLTVK
ncbi:MAG: DUF1801 domain-containing protein [Opitutaceae bacterium]